MTYNHSLRVFKFKEIVLGNSLHALSFAWDRKLPVFFITNDKPLLKNLQKWNELFINLSSRGLIIFAENQIKKLHFKNKSFQGLLNDGSFFDVSFNKCRVFNPESTNLLYRVKYPSTALIVDNFEIKKECSFFDKPIPTKKRKTCSFIHFYNDSRRTNKIKHNKVIAVSPIKARFINDFDYDEHLVALALNLILLESGYSGSKNGFLNGERRFKNYSFKHLGRIFIQNQKFKLSRGFKGVSISKSAIVERVVNKDSLLIQGELFNFDEKDFELQK
ncbi:MAG: hypothetical protein HC875_33605 [Anaerolineales bacterium]|nr:hypothetical protein [Anaerolineales bacterium]